MAYFYRLFWLRETGCDAGTLLRADELDPEIQGLVQALADESAEETVLRLPFFDKNEMRRRGEIFASLSWQRRGNEICADVSPHQALRDLGAQLAFTDPMWAGVPKETDPEYFHVWQRVSLALQKSLRTWIAETYFEDLARFDDRSAAYPMLVYESARLYHGKPPLDFTYDLHDYPHCLLTLALALKLTGRALQANLAQTERRLHDSGNAALARRYAPRWYQDILRGVRARPRAFIELLAAERRLIDAVVDLGANRTASGVNRFARSASQALRNVYGMDLRELGLRALHLTTEILAENALAENAVTADLSNAEQDGMVEVNAHECLRTPEGLRPGME
jgi:hypothetical protein